MKIVVLFVILKVINSECGLLNDVLHPVTDKAQNNALLDESKPKSNANKGLVTRLVNKLDDGTQKVVDTVTGLLNQGKNGKDIKSTTILPSNFTESDKNDTLKEIPNPTTEISNTTEVTTVKVEVPTEAITAVSEGNVLSTEKIEVEKEKVDNAIEKEKDGMPTPKNDVPEKVDEKAIEENAAQNKA